MYIHNVRYGFATNSSSTHSIVMLSSKAQAADNYDSGFGWDHFTCVSETAKRQYMGQVLVDNFESLHNMGRRDAVILASNWCEIEVDPQGYIDHQSMITLPSSCEYGQYS